MHARTSIRKALQALLIDQTDAGSNVFTNRSSTLFQDELPAIVITSNQEDATPRDLQATSYIRTLTCAVEVKVEAADETTDDQLDAFALLIEQIVIANSSLNGTAQAVLYKSASTEYSSNGDAYFGHITLTFEIQYLQ